jgi:hypothetical protein
MSITPSACAPSSRRARRRRSSRRRTASAASAAAALTHGWNARINQRQFSLPQPLFPNHFDWPTHVFRDALSLRLGDTEVRVPPPGRDRRLLGVDRGRLSLHRRPDHLAGAELRQSAEGPALSGRMGDAWPASTPNTLPRPRPRHPRPRGVRTVLTETAQYLRVIIDRC